MLALDPTQPAPPRTLAPDMHNNLPLTHQINQDETVARNTRQGRRHRGSKKGREEEDLTAMFEGHTFILIIIITINHIVIVIFLIGIPLTNIVNILTLMERPKRKPVIYFQIFRVTHNAK